MHVRSKLLLAALLFGIVLVGATRDDDKKSGRYRIVTVMGAFEFEPDTFELPLSEPGPIEVGWKIKSP